jgi:fumarate hydratase class II
VTASLVAASMDAAKFGVEEESLGNLEIPAERLWGAQTERSHCDFPIGLELDRFMPLEAE